MKSTRSFFCFSIPYLFAMSFKLLLAVFLGGGLGCVLRFLITLGVNSLFTLRFPLATLLVNVIGCFLIGLFSSWGAKTFASEAYAKFLIPGLCGGLTTFSTFSNELFTLLSQGRLAVGGLYLLSSLLVGVFAVFVGYSVGRRLI